jgi:GntR family transcriptional regulator, transcriptional repressor for pyruvate dehydrogenase complex
VNTGLDLGATVLGAARSRHAFEDCVERLATAIRLGVYPDGSTLPPERELSVRMGVSRATLREAIAALRTANMVRTTRGRAGGTIVDHPPVTPGEDGGITTPRAVLMDSLVFRRIVEPGACYLAAAQPLDDEQRAMLDEAHTAVEEAGNPADHRLADSRLHLAIASLTGSDQLVDAVTNVQSHLHEMLIAIPSLPVNIAHSSRQHADIVTAILQSNAKRARATMENHCDDTAALLRGLLR